MLSRNFLSFAAALMLVFSTIMISGGSASASDGSATVTLAVDSDFIGADQPVIVHVTIANPTRHSLKVLKWYTPADEVEGPLFSIEQDGQRVDYIGPLYKRPKPSHEAYIILKAGKSITFDVDIASYYDLSVSAHYSIIYDVSSPDLYSEKRNGKKDADRLTSNEIMVFITGRESSISQTTESLAGVSGSNSFRKCTTTQQSTLTTARTEASNYSNNADLYLNAGMQGSRYTTWFGAYDFSRYGTVTSHFESIADAMDTANVTFDCSCKKNYYAYVYANRPYNIYLCRVFWTAPLTGTDSKAGTLIHEMSHFYNVASTNDWVYGQTGAKNLALSDPQKAITNADNHEYFAENTPALQ